MSGVRDVFHPPGAKSLAAAVAVQALAVLSAATAVQSVLDDDALSGTIISHTLHERIVEALTASANDSRWTVADSGVSWPLLAGAIGVVASLAWFGGAAIVWLAGRKNATVYSLPTGMRFGESLARVGLCAGAWWLLPGLWEVLRIATSQTGWQSATVLVVASTPFWFALAGAGWLASVLAQAMPRDSGTRSGVPVFVWAAAAVYTLVFTAMNWQLYFALNLPHGDSAMYEEHLWNLTHGKGFRSYLDQGLFLGEHIQAVHLLLIPLHLLWPSHLLLELCQSAALASGAIATFLIARRRTGSARSGCCLAAAYLLYFPMQFLDVSIDVKTFRPIAFGVPLLLFALDQLERGRYRTMLVLLLLALSAKEDYAIVIAPLGVWIAACALAERRAPPAEGQQNPGFSKKPWFCGTSWRRRAWLGGGLACGATVYLLATVVWIIPAFRGGDTVHYSRYFQSFGNTLGEIIETMLARPGLVADQLLTAESALYSVALLAPLGFLPLLSPARLLVAVPLFFTLCLNEIARDPRHHFHAPLVPIVIWACAAGVGRIPMATTQPAARRASRRRFACHFAWTSALATGMFFSLGPLSMAFWDSGSSWHWRALYVPDERAAGFEKVAALVPPHSRVASTDFVHPRFTHHERSYDYSEYPREVNQGRPGAPPDAEFIVIDKQDRYRRLAPSDKRVDGPLDVPEYRREPRSWDVLLNDEYFLVLQRRTGV